MKCKYARWTWIDKVINNFQSKYCWYAPHTHIHMHVRVQARTLRGALLIELPFFTKHNIIINGVNLFVSMYHGIFGPLQLQYWHTFDANKMREVYFAYLCIYHAVLWLNGVTFKMKVKGSQLMCRYI